MLRCFFQPAARQAFIPVVCTVILLIIRTDLIFTTAIDQLTSFYRLYSVILQALYSACGNYNHCL